jgi:hypothetical protein
MANRLAKRLWLGGLFLAVCVPAGGQQTTVIPLATSSTWRFESSQKVSVGSLRAWGADPAIEGEYGVSAVERRTYTLYPEEDSVDALIEKASDPSAAYGLLTVYSSARMSPLKDLPLTRLGPGSALMVRGSNFIRIVRPPEPAGKASAPASGPNPGPPAAERPFPFSLGQLRELLGLVGGQGPSADELKSLPTALPLKGLIQGSEKYLLGEAAAQRVMPSFPTKLLGFSMGAEVRMATYAAGGEKVRVLVITYPTPQIARLQYAAMEKSLPLNPPAVPGAAHGKQTGSFVILVLDAQSPSVAAKLLNGLKSSENVSWDRPYPGDVPFVIQVVRLVLANLLLTLILAGFATGGGLIFFICKRLAMKWFPQTEFGQPDEATIIRLNLE